MRDLDSASETTIPHMADEERDRTLKEELQKLAEEAKAYAEAELQFQKSRTAYAASAIKSVVAFVVIALVLAFFAVMALILGLVLALTPLITAWGAAAVVTVVLLGLSVLLLLRAKRRISVIASVFSQGGDR